MASPKIKTRGLTIFKNKHRSIQKIYKEGRYPCIHGDKVWFSSYFIMDHLKYNPPKKNARIIEIGSGWGLLSIYCAKKHKAKVTAVDADKNVVPFLQFHARKNKVTVKSKICRYENVKSTLLKQQDMMIGADICFWKELIDPLYSIIKKARKNNVDTIIIADPGRAPFLALAKRCKKNFNAELVYTCTKKPTEEYGYLLIISRQA